MKARAGWRWVCFAVGCAVVSASGSVEANEAHPATDAERLFWEGMHAIDRGDLEVARAKLEESVALSPRGSALMNLAHVEWRLGKQVESLKHLRAALQATDVSGRKRDAAKEGFDIAYAATGHIVVHTESGAKVSVDGVEVDGIAPLQEPVDVTAGKHQVEARVGDRVGRAEVNATAGSVVTAELRMEEAAKPPAVAPEKGTAVPSATPMLPTPTAAEAPPGVLREQEPNGFWSPGHAVGLGVAAVGLVGVGVGVYFYSQAADARSRANSISDGLGGGSGCTGAGQPSACGRLSDATGSQRTDTTLEGVFLGVGAAALAAGAGIYFLWPKSSTVHIAVLPLVSREGAGLQLGGDL
jgi:hypothetical protein